MFQNEIISLLANDLTSTIINEVKNNQQYRIIADDATGVSNKTILTLVYQTVYDNLITKEYFTSTHVVSNLKNSTLEEKILVRLCS